MSKAPSDTAARARLADRLASARDTRFIGRHTELDLFRAALAADHPPFAVLHVYGPGGVGKTTLVRQFARLAEQSGRPVIALDGRDIRASRQDFLGAIGEAISTDGQMPPRTVLIVDTYETVSSLDAWLRDRWLPTLPADAIVVFAGRAAPRSPWRTDVAWAPLTRIVALGNFASEESVAFLDARGVPAASHARVLDFTHGHPLALTLTADVLASRGAAFDLGDAPDVVHHLLNLFVESMPSGANREALDICAAARVTSEPLLVALLGEEQGRAAFHWLRAQSFVEHGTRGLFPHDLVREVLIADARWRDLEGLRRLSRRIYAAVHARMAAARGRERQCLQMDGLYVTRTRSTHSAFFDWQDMDDVRVDDAAPDDEAWIIGLIDRHEGAASAALARQWWRTQPRSFRVLRGAQDAAFGFLTLLELGGPIDRADRAAGVGRFASAEPDDPAVAAARAFVAHHGPVRRGEVVLYLRWWMHADAYQAVTAAINLTAMYVVSHCTTRAEVAWNFVAMADPAFWAPHFEGVNFARVPDADFEVGGRPYGVFAHDWRFESADTWIAGTRVPMPFSPQTSAGAPASPVTVLSEADFLRAVRDALRDHARSGTFADNPLQHARMLAAVPDASADRAAALRRLLREAAGTLAAHPRDHKLHRAVWHTYFEPLATQEAVAERLGLPFSTYRRHLRQAIARIGATLWQRERAALVRPE